MKIAVLMFLLAPVSAFAGTVVRFAAPAASAVAPIRLQAPGMSGTPSLQILAAPSLSLSPTLSASALAAPSAPSVVKALTPAALSVAAPAQARILSGPTAKAVAVPLAQAAASNPARALSALLDSSAASADWTAGGQRFDGMGFQSGAQLVDPNSWQYRRLSGGEQVKLNIALNGGNSGSAVFQNLNGEFARQGGYYVLDGNRNAGYMAAAAVDNAGRPVIVLTYDLFNRYNGGRREEMYLGAPWEFIASVIAREQVFYNSWYSVVPASAEKLSASLMNMVRVFVDLTNGGSRLWATDKDFQAVAGNRASVVNWSWFEQLVIAARAAAQGVGTNNGHLLDSKFFSWIYTTGRDNKPGVPAFQYSLWEQLDGKYYRPGDARNGQPLPPGAPRIDQATYDRAAYTAYGADGKGSAQAGGRDQKTVYGWIIQWLKDRFEV